MYKRLNKYFEILIFLLIAVILFIILAANTCKTFSSPTFDSQALLVWDYSASIGLFPYRDIFYPYGFLNYFKNQSAIFSAIYLLTTPLLFTSLFFAMKNIFHDKLFALSSFIFFFLFVINFTGIEAFNRYGVLIVVLLFFSYVFFYERKDLNKWIFLAGLLVGVIFSFINDQGVYAVLLFLLYLIIDKFLNKKAIHKFVFYHVAKETIIFFVGFAMGIVPLFTYLYYNYSISNFVFYLVKLPQLSLYSKTPFIHSVVSIDNIFTLGILILSISFLTYKFSFGNKKITFNTFVQIGLIFVLIILEQKSIIRQMDKQITFIGLLLFMSLVCELKGIFQKHKVSKYKIFMSYAFVLIVFFSLMELYSSKNILYRPTTFKDSVKAIHSFQSNTCAKKNINIIPREYEKVKEAILRLSKNPRVFSFPSDPVFYIIFNQIPPYYLNTYDGSSVSAQNDSISYIGNNNVNFILINSELSAVQDEVPDYVRAQTLHSYILINFILKEKIGKFLILEENKYKEDFFANKMLDSLPEYKKNLLQINLQNIPRAEGYHKRKYLFFKENKEIVNKTSIDEFNSFLFENEVNTEKKLLLIKFVSQKQDMAEIVIKTSEGLVTKVSFVSCEVDISCIINLSNIPLFYRSRNLAQITSKNGDYIQEIALLDIADESNFW